MTDLIEYATTLYAKSIVGLTATDEFDARVKIIATFFKLFRKYHRNAQFGRDLSYDHASVEQVGNLEQLFLDLVSTKYSDEYLVAKIFSDKVK